VDYENVVDLPKAGQAWVMIGDFKNELKIITEVFESLKNGRLEGGGGRAPAREICDRLATTPSTKKNPRRMSGGPNQKPLTIKPYPMKIR
jgi:hypothetical protein